MIKAMILSIIKKLENENISLIIEEPISTKEFTILKITYRYGSFNCKQSIHHIDGYIYVCSGFSFPPSHVHTEGVLNIYDVLFDFFNKKDVNIFFL